MAGSQSSSRTTYEPTGCHILGFFLSSNSESQTDVACELAIFQLEFRKRHWLLHRHLFLPSSTSDSKCKEFFREFDSDRAATLLKSKHFRLSLSLYLSLSLSPSLSLSLSLAAQKGLQKIYLGVNFQPRKQKEKYILEPGRFVRGIFCLESMQVRWSW